VYAAHVCTENFEVLARAVATGNGSPEHPVVALPKTLEFPETWDNPELVKQYAEQVVYEVFGV
jgi:hypothetical protein